MLQVIKMEVKFEENKLERIVLDFERACFANFAKEFPEADLVGCEFHWKQCLYRNLQTTGLIPLYNQDQDFQFYMKLIYSLAYVPIDRIGDAYDTVVLRFLEDHEDDENFVEGKEDIAEYESYIERTWIGKKRNGNRRPPLFNYQTWSKYESILDGKATTNNSSEGFNSAWNQSMEKKPSVWSVVEGFRREDCMARTSLREQAVGGDASDRKKYRTLRREQRREEMRQLCQRFNNLPLKEYMGLMTTFV